MQRIAFTDGAELKIDTTRPRHPRWRHQFRIAAGLAARAISAAGPTRTSSEICFSAALRDAPDIRAHRLRRYLRVNALVRFKSGNPVAAAPRRLRLARKTAKLPGGAPLSKEADCPSAGQWRVVQDRLGSRPPKRWIGCA